MALEVESPGELSGEPDLRYELVELTRGLRAHVDCLMQSGAFGVPKADPPNAPSITEPPPSHAPKALPSFGGAPLAVAASAPTPNYVAPKSPATATSPVFSLPDPVPLSRPPAGPVAVVSRAAPQELAPEEKKRRLDILADGVAGCTKCRLHERRMQTVFARGTGSSGLCFVGEGPGADEDAQGFPFVGAAGQLLDKMISAMGMTRDEVYVCNIVKCRPPENRKPLPDEMSTCKPYLDEQLEILTPQVIVALGATAVEGLLGGSFGGITRLRGNWKLYQGRIAVMPTFHPAYLLRAPSGKHAVWEDMQAVLRHLGRPVPARGKK